LSHRQRAAKYQWLDGMDGYKRTGLNLNGLALGEKISDQFCWRGENFDGN